MEKTEAVTIRKVLTVENMLLSVGFLFPLLFNSAQIVNGAVVNTVLFLSASRLKGNRLILISILPSIGALANGFLFGKFTIFLVYFLPFIWIGNYLLMRLSKTDMLLAVAVKTIILFSVAYIFVSFHFVPKIFLTAMGFLQLATALIGGTLAFGIATLIRSAHD